MPALMLRLMVMGVRQVFESLFDNVSGYVVTISLKITPLSDVILPPMSSRFLKFLVFESRCFADIRDVVGSRASFKGVTLFALRRGVRRLYSTTDSQSLLVVRAGEVLSGRLAVYSRDFPHLLALSGCEDVVNFHGSSVAYSIEEVIVEDVSTLSLGITRGSIFKLIIHTPLLLPTKLMTPPPLTGSKLISSIKSGYRLLPTPSYILSAACREWLGIVKNEKVEGHIAPYVVGRISDIAVHEIDANIKPVTVVYGKNEKGKPRLVRGVIGYIAYKLESKKLEKVVDKLLAFTTRVGLGKSRSIGFGEVEIKPFNTTYNSHRKPTNTPT